MSKRQFAGRLLCSVACVTLMYTADARMAAGQSPASPAPAATSATPPESPKEERAVLEIHCPADAELTLEGVKMKDTGEERRFRSPPLKAGKEYLYSLKATWKEEGKVRVVERKVEVAAGKQVVVDLIGDDLTRTERAVLNLTNAQRRAYGLVPLRCNRRLMAAARRHSQNMAAYSSMSHSLNGEYTDRIAQAGYQPANSAENIAAGQASAEDVVNTWMNSSGHRTNILNPDFTEIGIGIAQNGQPYYTQVFARPAQ